MKNYEHITRMEDILDQHQQKLIQLRELLDDLKLHKGDYRKLMDYYYSEQYRQDLEDDDNGLIDPHLKRGVLSEDAIYNLIAYNYQCCIEMLEVAISYLKQV